MVAINITVRLCLFFRLVCGDVEGKFKQIFKRVALINQKSGPFDVSMDQFKIRLNSTFSVIHIPHVHVFVWPSWHYFRDIELKCCIFHNFHTFNKQINLKTLV